MSSEVAILCAASDSVYKGLAGCDVYDENRNAWSFRGGRPVVAHTPCRMWGALSQFVKDTEVARCSEILLGLWCVGWVRRCGGVLEQPAGSALFRAAGIPAPGERGLGFSIEVPQYWWGHSADKFTWLYFYGIEPRYLPEIPFALAADRRRSAGGRCVGGVEWLSKRDREATPSKFAAWLVEAARRCAV